MLKISKLKVKPKDKVVINARVIFFYSLIILSADTNINPGITISLKFKMF